MYAARLDCNVMYSTTRGDPSRQIVRAIVDYNFLLLLQYSDPKVELKLPNVSSGKAAPAAALHWSGRSPVIHSIVLY